MSHVSRNEIEGCVDQLKVMLAFEMVIRTMYQEMVLQTYNGQLFLDKPNILTRTDTNFSIGLRCFRHL